MASPTHTISALVILSLVLPAVSVAAAQPQVKVQDSIAGLETSAQVLGLPANTEIALQLLTPTGENITLPARTDNTGTAAVRILSGLTETAGNYGIYAVRDGARVTTEATFTVLPDRISPTESSLDASSSVLRGGASVTVWVTLRDRFGNTLAGRPVELISSRPSDSIEPSTRETDSSGTQEFTVSALQPGAVQLRAMDLLSGLTLAEGLTLSAEDARGQGGSSPVRSVNTFSAQLNTGEQDEGDDDGAVEFRIAVSPENPQVGDWLDLQVTALRADGSRAQGYTRNPAISAPNDPDAELPAFNTLDFIRQEDGRDRCLQCLSFSTPGTQTLRVEDELADGTIIQGELTLEVTASEEYMQNRKIEVLSHRDGGRISSPNIVLEGIGPKLANLIITGGLRDVETDTDSKGYFSAQVELAPSFNEYTIRVQSVEEGGGSAQYDSGPLHLIRDGEGPEVEFRFEPEEPLMEQDASLTVRSEPDLASVTVLIGNREISLAEDPQEKGTYSVVFSAPAAGSYQPAITATDDAGNRTEVRASLTVLPRDLPQVQNLRATPVNKNTIALSWNPVAGEEITSYIVFIGTDNTLSLSTLETPNAGAAAEVRGLEPGREYFFAVTAKQGDRQGSVRSETVSALTPGLSLDITPRASSLLLEWKNTDKTRLKHYLVEYGTSANAFTEQREVRPKDDSSRIAQPYTLDDLMSGQLYYVRVTPVRENTEFQLDLSVTGSASTLSSDGFNPVSPGSIPFDLTDGHSGPLPDGFHTGAPSTPGSGLPLGATAGIAVASIVVFAVRRRRAATRETQEFLRMMQSRYHG